MFGLPEFGDPILRDGNIEDLVPYNLSRKKLLEHEVAIHKVGRMFQESNDRSSMFRLRLRKLDKMSIEQVLVCWFDGYIYTFMHTARKIMQVKNEVKDPKEAQEYIDKWISNTSQEIVEDWRGTLEWIAKNGKKSWEKFFGSHEHNPIPLYHGLVKYQKIINENERKELEELKTMDVNRVDCSDILRKDSE